MYENANLFQKIFLLFQKVDAEKVRYAMQLAVVQKRADKAEAKVVSFAFTFEYP